MGCFSPRSPVEAAPLGPDQAPSSHRALPLGTEAPLSSSSVPTLRTVLWVLPSSDPPHSTASAGHPSSVHSVHLCSRGPTPWSPGPRLYSSPLPPHPPQSRTPASACWRMTKARESISCAGQAAGSMQGIRAGPLQHPSHGSLPFWLHREPPPPPWSPLAGGEEEGEKLRTAEWGGGRDGQKTRVRKG